MFDKINHSSSRLAVGIDHLRDVVDIVDDNSQCMNSVDASSQLSSTSIEAKPLKDNSSVLGRGKAIADHGSDQRKKTGKLVLMKCEYLEDDEGKFPPSSSSDFIESFHENLVTVKSSLQPGCVSKSYENVAFQNKSGNRVARNTSVSNDLIIGSHYKLRHPQEEAMTKNNSWFPRHYEAQSAKHDPLSVETADRVAIGDHFAESVRSKEPIVNKPVWSKMSNSESNQNAIESAIRCCDQSLQSQIQHSQPGSEHARCNQQVFRGSSGDRPTSSRLRPVTSDMTYDSSQVNKRSNVLAETKASNSGSANDNGDFQPFKSTYFQSMNKTGMHSSVDDIKSSYFLNGNSATNSTQTSEFCTSTTTHNHCRMPRPHLGIPVFDENCANDTKTLPQFCTRKPEIACVMPLIRSAVTLQKNSQTRIERVTFSVAMHEPNTSVASVSTSMTKAFRGTRVSRQTERSSSSVLERKSSLFTTIGPNRSSLTGGLIQDQRYIAQQGGVRTSDGKHLKDKVLHCRDSKDDDIGGESSPQRQ